MRAGFFSSPPPLKSPHHFLWLRFRRGLRRTVAVFRGTVTCRDVALIELICYYENIDHSNFHIDLWVFMLSLIYPNGGTTSVSTFSLLWRGWGVGSLVAAAASANEGWDDGLSHDNSDLGMQQVGELHEASGFEQTVRIAEEKVDGDKLINQVFPSQTSITVTCNHAEHFTCGTFDELVKLDALLEFKPASGIWSSKAVYKTSDCLSPRFGAVSVQCAQLNVDTQIWMDY
ncbi:hypothetical protein F2P81_016721 [Scophthalmus maximus]|uniref:Uncharacterized protein n=1 Tax=Scophthalmus maximus TaxID=52904 RepID=A0A6A4SDW9_SCOMX|nr:hypothetical protein F2P81_016721 [Scophthalmus maximus]